MPVVSRQASSRDSDSVRVMKLASKLTTGAAVSVVILGLGALALPAILPFLPSRAQVALGGTIDTVPGTVNDLYARTGTADHATKADEVGITHAAVDEEYVIAASIWPWDLPADWRFPRSRGVADTPGHHWNGMGVKAAFSIWATATLDEARSGDLTEAEANRLLDEVTDATDTLIAAGLLTDSHFVARSVDPLRP